MPSALDGIRILDLSRLLPGPFATQLLADYGADVVKIEEPGTGDYLRSFVPFVNGESAFFLHLNRNKRSVCLDLKNEEGRRVLRELVRGADVLVESFRPGVMERLGVGYEALARENPGLVYCALTGYGLDGPHAQEAGHDVNYLARAGLLGILTGADGRPALPGFQIADIGGGALNAVIGILLALVARQATGRGQLVDAAMVDGLAPWLVYRLAFEGASEVGPGPCLSGEYPCYAVYETSDRRFVALGALEAKFWKAFCLRVGRPEWVALQFDRGSRDRLFAEVTALFASRTRDEWARELATADCCAAPVLELAELPEDANWKARGLLQRFDDPARGPLSLLGFPVKLSDTPAAVRRGPPRLGEHTDEVLQTLGYTPAAVAELRAAGAVG